MRIPLALGVQSGEAPSPPVSSERLVNAYLEQAPQGKAPTPVYGSPGLVRVSSTSFRGLLQSRERLYGVTSTSLVEIAANGTLTTLGAVPAGSVDMASDGTNVVVTCGGSIYVWDGDSFAQVTDPDAPSASSVEWINGFFIFTETDTEQWFIAPQANPSGDYDALDFDSSDVTPDALVRIRRVGRTLLMCGRQSIEFWYYSGDPVFPFARYQDEPIGVGVAGPQAIVSTNETAFFLASDKTVRRLDGRTATRISTFAMEKLIAGWSDISETVVTEHVYNGHLFITLRNPDGCIVWDQATQTWHERASNGSTTWRVAYQATAFGSCYFGGDDGLYTLGGYDEADDPLTLEMITPWVDSGGDRFSVYQVELRMEAGAGSLTLDPKVTLERTEDGEEWSAPMLRGFGKTGERFRRVVFSCQGMSRGCAFRIRISDPVKRVIYAAYAEVG